MARSTCLARISALSVVKLSGNFALAIVAGALVVPFVGVLTEKLLLKRFHLQAAPAQKVASVMVPSLRRR